MGLRGALTRTGRTIGVGVNVAVTSVVRTAAERREGSCLRAAVLAGPGACGRASWSRIQRGASTIPVATQSAPAPAPLTQKPMIVAIVEMRPPPPEVAM